MVTKMLKTKKNIEKILDLLYLYFFDKYYKVNGKKYFNRALKLLKKELQIYNCEIIDFTDKFLDLKPVLHQDLLAYEKNDPSYNIIDEIVFTSPGLYAIMSYRVANILYKKNVRIIPRMMTEIVHFKTGIDIHPGATIGSGFFIDHGTGVVIGQTTIIGCNVKIYQGVTLGALSLKDGNKLRNSKRHPTIGNNVTIYANASILGGNTIVEDNITIGANDFIIKSINKNTYVSNKKGENL